MSSAAPPLPFFCTATNHEDEEDFIQTEDVDDQIHSPTDSSEDSVEVKVSPISGRNKRKTIEPRKVQDSIDPCAKPLKKRMCLQNKATIQEQQPFRPWSMQLKDPKLESKPKVPLSSVPIKTEVPSEKSKPTKNSQVPASHFNIPFPCPSVFNKKKELTQSIFNNKQEQVSPFPYFRPPSPIKIETASPPPKPLSLVKRTENKSKNEVLEALRVPIHPSSSLSVDTEKILCANAESFPRLQTQSARKEQRNYKNMSRERRIEANARERTRVHTISAAFDTLRRSIPAYSHSQKLSKLSVLRIACSYIMTLSNLVHDEPSAVPDCIESVTRTIQKEGKLRKKKEDSD